MLGLLLLSQFLFLKVVAAPTDSMEVIEALFAREQWEEALKGYETLVKFEDTAPEALYRIGECYYNLKQYQQAIAVFEHLRKTYPQSYLCPEAIYSIGMCWLVLGDAKLAKKYLIDEIDKFPGYVEEKRILCGKGIALYAEGKYKDALIFLEKLHTKEGLYYKAKCFAAMGDPLKALEIYRQLVDQYPNTKLAEYSYFCMGDALFDNSDYPGASRKYEEFLNKYPWTELKDYARYKLGCCYLDAREYEKAIQMFNYSVKASDPWVAAHSYYQLGIARRSIGRLEDAVTVFQKTKGDYPEMRVAALAHVRYGQCFIDRGDTTGAQLSFQQVITAYPTGNFAGLGDFLTATAFFIQKRYTEAIERYQRVIRLFPKSEAIIPAYAMSLYSYLQLGSFTEGASMGTSFLKLLPDTNELWVGRSKLFLAELYYYLDRTPKAKDFYDEVINNFLEPEVKAPAVIGKAYCLLEQGNTSASHDMLKDAYDRWSSIDTSLALQSLYGWGISSFNAGDLKDAYEVFLGMGDVYPESELAGNAFYHGGKALSALALHANAIEYWTKVLDEYPDCPRAPNAAFDLGRTYFLAAKYDDAVENYTLILEQYSKSLPGGPALARDAQFQLGATYFQARQFEDAVREYQKFIDIYPEDSSAIQAKTQIQTAFYIQGQEDPGALEELIKRYPTCELAGEAQWLIAANAQNDEDYEKAIVEFQKLIVNFPKSSHASEAQYFIISNYGLLKEYEKRIEECKKFLKYFPEDPKVSDVWFQLGATYFNESRFMDALKPFQTILDKYPAYEKHDLAGYYLGRSYKNLGETAKGDRLMEKYQSATEKATEKQATTGKQDTTQTPTKP